MFRTDRTATRIQLAETSTRPRTWRPSLSHSGCKRRFTGAGTQGGCDVSWV